MHSHDSNSGGRGSTGPASSSISKGNGWVAPASAGCRLRVGTFNVEMLQAARAAAWRSSACNSSNSSCRRSEGRGRLRRLPSSSYYSWDVSFHVRVSLAAFRNAQNATASNYSSSSSNSAVQRASDLAAALATALEASDMVSSLEARGLPVDST